MKLFLRINHAINHNWPARLFAILAGLVTLVQAIVYAHYMNVTMDEGTYLFKGLLFIRGVYVPFQEYGPWTNKMPLAFLIPGTAQAIFEPGLRTGRYFSIFLLMLLLLGLWVTSRRMAGSWWAAATLWLVAINPAGIIYYCVATSQVISACLLTGSLALLLGEKRSLWKVLLGAGLSAALVLTRQNMLPALVFTLAYIFWQHGRKAGWLSVLVAAALLGIIHAIFWPRIFSFIWLGWVPAFLRPLFQGFYLDTEGAWKNTRQSFDWLSKQYVVWEGIRYHFSALAGALAAWLFWPRKKDWRTQGHLKATVFLSVLLVSLTIAHYWAAAGKDYCLYCFTGYLAFFSPAGLLLPGLVFSGKIRQPGTTRQVTALLLVVLICTGIGFGAFQVLDDTLLTLQFPRMRYMRFLPGTADLWRLLANKFGLSYNILQQMIPAGAGLLVGLLLAGSAVITALVLRRKALPLKAGTLAFSVFLLLGVILSPTAILGGGKLAEQCSEDVIQAHEKVGAALAAAIPPGSLVYWQNDVSPLPLLYISNVRIYPPQLNHDYSRLIGGDPDKLVKNGYWNDALADQWLREADYILMAESYGDAWRGNLENEAIFFDELEPTPLTVPCRDRSIIHIYQRIR
jgi:hypothetical protein